MRVRSPIWTEVPRSIMSDETPLKIVIVGHVDHGKSTLIGRLFYDTDSLPDGKYEQIRDTCQRRGVPFEWAFLMDALQAEREQNITIDTSQIWFQTDQRPYTIIDAPGHKEFLKNMITGAASADAALLVIAADEGVQEQSRRHGHMLSMLGIDQVAVVVNKMDLVDYRREVFDEITAEYTAFLEKLGIEPETFIPISAREGDNVAGGAEGEAMPWYDGTTVVEMLDAFEPPKVESERPLRFPLQDIYRFDDKRILAGRIESGRLEVGQELLFEPGSKTGVVESIEWWNVPRREEAVAGDSMGITLSEQIFVERGHVGADPDHPPTQTRRFEANLFWMRDDEMEVGADYKLKLATQEVECSVVEVLGIIDGSTLESVGDRRGHIARYDVANVIIETRHFVAIDTYRQHPALGRFVVVDDYDIAGGGIIVDVLAVEDEPTLSGEPVEQRERENKRGHRGAVIALSGDKAETVAPYVERALFDGGIDAVYLKSESQNGIDAELASRVFERWGLAVITVDDADEDQVLVDGELEFPLPSSDDEVAGLVADLVAYLRR